MSKIYRSILSFLPLYLVLTITSANAAFSILKKEIDPIKIIPTTTNYTLKWNKTNNGSVVVFVSETKTVAITSTFEEILPVSEFKRGANFNGAFAVYKGEKDEVEITGLKAGSTYYVSIFETSASGELTNITDKISFEKQLNIYEKLNPLANNDASEPLIAPTVDKPSPGNGPTSSAFTTVCAPVSGITCTLSGTTSSGYIAGSSPCNANSFTTVNPWDGGSCSGYIAFNFSSAVKSIVVKMIAVNSIVDKTTLSQTGGAGGSLSVNSTTCMSFAGVVLGPYTGPGSYGDVSARITSSGTFTTVTCTNTGCNSGWVAACPSYISTLPIELVSFTSECNTENVVDLKWTTVSETNNNFFTIERSADTRDWEIIGTIKGAGTSVQTHEYSFVDKQRFGGTIYYRIKQTDFNGDFKYSEIVAARNCKIFAESIQDVSFYPNPSSGEITVNSNSDATVMEIYNPLGIVVAKKDLVAGENKFSISDLANGAYFIKVFDATQSSKMTPLIINH